MFESNPGQEQPINQGLTFYTISLWILNINIEIILARVCTFKFNFWHVDFKYVLRIFDFYYEGTFLFQMQIFIQIHLWFEHVPFYYERIRMTLYLLILWTKLALFSPAKNKDFWNRVWRIFMNSIMIHNFLPPQNAICNCKSGSVIWQFVDSSKFIKENYRTKIRSVIKTFAA